MAWIRFCDSEFLGRLYPFLKTSARFHSFNNHICRRVESPAEAPQLHRGQSFAKERKDRSTVQNGRLKHKGSTDGRCELIQLTIPINNWAFVCSDGVSTGLQRRSQVINRRLSGHGIQGSCFEYNVRTRGAQPLTDSAQRWRHHRTVRKQLDNIEAALIGEPAHPPSGHARNPPIDSVKVAKFTVLCRQQTRQSTTNISESQKAKIELIHSPPRSSQRIILLCETIPRPAQIDSCKRPRTQRSDRCWYHLSLWLSNAFRSTRRLSDRNNEESTLSLGCRRVVLVSFG